MGQVHMPHDLYRVLSFTQGTRRIRRMIKQAAKEAGLTERITPHVLRHTFATHMYERGVPADAISRIMGHDSIEETSLYIHVPEEMKKKALEKIKIP